jgi:transposase
VARVALSCGICADIVHGWRKLARQSEPVVEVAPATFVSMAGAAPVPMHEPRGIDVELRRGAATIRLIWPPGASSELANWLRVFLR